MRRTVSIFLRNKAAEVWGAVKALVVTIAAFVGVCVALYAAMYALGLAGCGIGSLFGNANWLEFKNDGSPLGFWLGMVPMTGLAVASLVVVVFLVASGVVVFAKWLASNWRQARNQAASEEMLARRRR